MERFTISLDAALAGEFNELIAARGYQNRSEAVRDLLRQQLEAYRMQRGETRHCIANVSYVYNHHERDLAERLAHLQHEHHNLMISTMHAHLDHEHCIETLILRGPTDKVRRFAERLIAERGVRHGLLNLVAADEDGPGHIHAGDRKAARAQGARSYRHVHLKPRY
ncbi:MAG: nickel-responsive transcriptional regulator NikR [Rhodospirillales bacterium]